MLNFISMGSRPLVRIQIDEIRLAVDDDNARATCEFLNGSLRTLFPTWGNIKRKYESKEYSRSGSGYASQRLLHSCERSYANSERMPFQLSFHSSFCESLRRLLEHYRWRRYTKCIVVRRTPFAPLRIWIEGKYLLVPLSCKERIHRETHTAIQMERKRNIYIDAKQARVRRCMLHESVDEMCSRSGKNLHYFAFMKRIHTAYSMPRAHGHGKISYISHYNMLQNAFDSI